MVELPKHRMTEYFRQLEAEEAMAGTNRLREHFEAETTSDTSPRVEQYQHTEKPLRVQHALQQQFQSPSRPPQETIKNSHWQDVASSKQLSYQTGYSGEMATALEQLNIAYEKVFAPAQNDSGAREVIRVSNAKHLQDLFNLDADLKGYWQKVEQFYR